MDKQLIDFLLTYAALKSVVPADLPSSQRSLPQHVLRWGLGPSPLHNLIYSGAKPSTPHRPGSKATTVMSQAPVLASSTLFATAVYSISVALTPACAASARPSATVVPLSSPEALSLVPMISGLKQPMRK